MRLLLSSTSASAICRANSRNATCKAQALSTSSKHADANHLLLLARVREERIELRLGKDGRVVVDQRLRQPASSNQSDDSRVIQSTMMNAL